MRPGPLRLVDLLPHRLLAVATSNSRLRRLGLIHNAARAWRAEGPDKVLRAAVTCQALHSIATPLNDSCVGRTPRRSKFGFKVAFLPATIRPDSPSFGNVDRRLGGGAWGSFGNPCDPEVPPLRTS